jgi:hypothetical protein
VALRNGIHAHPAESEFARQELGDLIDAALRHRVGEHLGQRRIGRSRRNIDDGTALTGIHHGLTEHLASQKDAAQIDIEDAIPFGFLDIEKRCARINARGVQKNIDAAESGERGFEGALDIRLGGDIRLARQTLASQVLDRLSLPLGALFVQIGDDDVGARPRKSHGHLAREHSSPADDHRGFPRQRKQFLD